MKIDQSLAELIMDVHEMTPIEGINRCMWSDYSSEKNLKFVANAVQAKIRDLILTKTIYDRYPRDSIRMMLENKLKVSVNLWNFCLHECWHCAIDWDRKWTALGISSFRLLIEKYSRELKYVNSFFFTGWELLDRKDFPEIIEEVLKRWISRIKFVSRSWLAFQPRNVRAIVALKEKYPDFELDLTLSMDNYSDTNNQKANKYLDRLTELVSMQFETFKKDKIDLISTIPFDDAEEADKQFKMIIRKINRLWNRVVKAWFVFKGHELVDWYDNFKFEKDWRKFEISAVYQMLVWRSDKSKDIKWSWKLLSREDACKYLYFSENSTFYADEAMNLNYCSHIAHWFEGGNWIINLMDSPKSKVIMMFLHTRQRFYRLLTYDEIVDYVLNPENKHLCSKLRQELSIIKK
ncbi:MAG: hypothetical protein ACD_2C00128G0004 [uncultured bacterium (gcode 4)]|uniref:Radical SAM core domain-containing protein n=1 Tax=uncultured bacterium (gcode 4) TaxID=1234023 RepID=K2FEQ9_9BACT|nr:MAG: hypothetical protein ACD_2C00128G0004 [uncultured bacterium (gcode 4)]